MPGRSNVCWGLSTHWVAKPGAARYLTSGSPTTSGCSSIGRPTRRHDMAGVVRTPGATAAVPFVIPESELSGTARLSSLGGLAKSHGAVPTRAVVLGIEVADSHAA